MKSKKKSSEKMQEEVSVVGKIRLGLDKKIRDSFLEFVSDCQQVIELEENKVKAAYDIKAVASLMAKQVNQIKSNIVR